MGLTTPDAWLHAGWVLTLWLAMPCVIGAVIRRRAPEVERAVTRTVILLSPIVLALALTAPNGWALDPIFTWQPSAPASQVESARWLAPSEAKLPEKSLDASEPSDAAQMTTARTAEPKWPVIEDTSPLPWIRPLPILDGPTREDRDAPASDIPANAFAETPATDMTAANVAPMTPPRWKPLELDEIDVADVAATIPRVEAVALTDTPPTLPPLVEPNESLANESRARSSGEANEEDEEDDAAEDATPRTAMNSRSITPMMFGKLCLFIWWLAAVVGVLQLTNAHRRLHRLRSGWRRLGRAAHDVVGRLAQRIRYRRRFTLFAGDASIEASASGWHRPAITIPKTWLDDLSRTDLEPLLLHELAHLKSRDPLWRTLSWLTTALVWPHPLIHTLARRERELSELIADREVLAAGADGRHYARVLGRLAIRYRASATGRVANPLTAGSFGTRNALEGRIRLLLNETNNLKHRASWQWTMVMIVGVLSTMLVVVSRPLVGAEASTADNEQAAVAPATPQVPATPVVPEAPAAPVTPMAAAPVVPACPPTPATPPVADGPRGLALAPQPSRPVLALPAAQRGDDKADLKRELDHTRRQLAEAHDLIAQMRERLEQLERHVERRAAREEDEEVQGDGGYRYRARDKRRAEAKEMRERARAERDAAREQERRARSSRRSASRTTKPREFLERLDRARTEAESNYHRARQALDAATRQHGNPKERDHAYDRARQEVREALSKLNALEGNTAQIGDHMREHAEALVKQQREQFERAMEQYERRSVEKQASVERDIQQFLKGIQEGREHERRQFEQRREQLEREFHQELEQLEREMAARETRSKIAREQAERQLVQRQEEIERQYVEAKRKAEAEFEHGHRSVDESVADYQRRCEELRAAVAKRRAEIEQLLEHLETLKQQHEGDGHGDHDGQRKESDFDRARTLFEQHQSEEGTTKVDSQRMGLLAKLLGGNAKVSKQQALEAREAALEAATRAETDAAVRARAAQEEAGDRESETKKKAELDALNREIEELRKQIDAVKRGTKEIVREANEGN